MASSFTASVECSLSAFLVSSENSQLGIQGKCLFKGIGMRSVIITIIGFQDPWPILHLAPEGALLSSPE